MGKPTLYLETTISSYYTARVSQNLIVAAHQALTEEWWQRESQKYNIYISQFVLDEAEAGDPDAAQRRMTFLNSFPLLEVTDEVLSVRKRDGRFQLFVHQKN